MIEFCLLGPVRVIVAGSPVPVGGRQRIALMTALLLHPNRVVSTERLANVLWGGRPPRTARSALHVRVSQLRRLLAEAQAGEDRVRWRPPGYLLRVEPGELDVQRFTTLAGQGQELLAAGDAAHAAELLHEALRLFHGQPFENVTAEALAEHRTRLNHRRLAALGDRIDADLRLGRHATVLAELEALVAEHPLDERLRGQLMLALYRSGRRSDALAQYAAARRTMVDELALEPGDSLRRLQAAILNADPGLAVPSPRPPPAAEPAIPPAQLLPNPPHFTGRAESLRWLDARLPSRTASCAPVVISAIAGLAGVGKTTLAMRWGHRVRSHFPDGQLYLNLRGFDRTAAPIPPTEALRTLLDGLGVAADRIPYGVDAQASLYRSRLTGKRMLIVLDNARDAEQVRPLLPGSPGSLALVTSRNQLIGLVATDGAELLRVEVFDAAQARALLTERLGHERVSAEPAAVAEIIAHCAGLPLALSVAAARAVAEPHCSLTALAAELRDNELNALTVGDAASDVRAVFASSYRHLGASARRLVRLLALHPGPDLTVAAAASLAAVTPTDAQAQLTELTRAAFVTELVPGRFGMHDLLRAYAAELVHAHETEPDRRSAIARLTDHYLHTACAAAQALIPHSDPVTAGEPGDGVRPEPIADRPAALAWFAEEQSVLLGVFHAATTARLDRQVVSFAWALTRFFDLQCRYRDMSTTQQAALAAARRLADLPGQARAHRLLGFSASRQGRYDEAREGLRRALELNRRLADHPAQGHTCMTLAQVFARTGSYSRALDYATAAHAAFRTGGHRFGQVNALNAIGWYHAQLGEHDTARTICEQAISLAQELGDTFSEASARDSLGYAHHQLGEHRQAAASYRRAIDLYVEVGDRYYEADTLRHLGDTLEASGQVSAAIAVTERALGLLEALGHADAGPAREELANRRAATQRRMIGQS